MIPNIAHFSFGLQPDFGFKPFSYIHYLAVKSACLVNNPSKIYLWYSYEPSGIWWNRAKEYCEPSYFPEIRDIFGNCLHHVCHKADVTRLLILQEFGGIFLDADTYCLRPFPLNGRFVLGQEAEGRIGNAVILSEPDHPFLKAWLETYRTFFSKGMDREWNKHSEKLPYEIAQTQEISLLEKKAFYPVEWYETPKLNREMLGDAYCFHWREQNSWDTVSKFTPADLEWLNKNAQE
jgi:mannosyltransferase OCH1-like enzyme